MTRRIPRRPWSRRRRQRKLRWRWAARPERYQWLQEALRWYRPKWWRSTKRSNLMGEGIASQLVTACRKKDPLCTLAQVAEVVRSHHADIRGADNAIAWILGQVPRFFEGGYQRPGDHGARPWTARSGFSADCKSESIRARRKTPWISSEKMATVFSTRRRWPLAADWTASAAHMQLLHLGIETSGPATDQTGNPSTRHSSPGSTETGRRLGRNGWRLLG